MEEYKLIVIKNPLLPQERETSVITLIPGKSILYYRKEHLPLDIDFIVFVNGEIISDDVLDTIFLQQNDVVIFKPKIEDPFTLAALAMIALSVAAWSVPIMLGVAGITAAIISAGIMIVGGLLISALMPVPDINSPNMTKEGATYSWSGPLNTQNQGIAIPVVYGKIRTGGNIIASHTTNDGDKQYLSALICPSMGPIHSISEIELNKQPIANFGATVDTRLGTIPQTVITYFEDTLETFDYDVLLANNVSHTYTTDGSEFNGLQFDITFPKGLQYIEDNGDKNNFSVTIQIEIKKTVLIIAF